VRAAQRTGEFGRQEEFAEDAARLLRDPEYRGESRWYVDLLKGLRDAATARPIVEAFVAAGPWPSPDTLSLVKTLVSRGCPGEALRVIDAIPAGARPLALCAYNAQITKRGFGINDPEVDAYLARIPGSERDRILGEVREMCEAGTFSISTLLLVRDAVRNRYRGWTAEIREEVEKTARAKLAEALRPEAAQRAIGLALRLGAATLGAAVVLALVLGGGILFFVIGLVLAAAVAAGGYVYTSDAEITRRVEPLLPRAVEERLRQERDAWHLVLDDSAAPFGTQAPAMEPTTPADPAEPAPPAQATPGPD
jgi:hypothetical protein